MEKRTPHCPLARVKTLVDLGRVRMTGSAIMGAAELGLDRQGMLTVVDDLLIVSFKEL